MGKTRTGKIKLDREWEEMVEEGMGGGSLTLNIFEKVK